jgi:hypothetical protein
VTNIHESPGYSRRPRWQWIDHEALGTLGLVVYVLAASLALGFWARTKYKEHLSEQAQTPQVQRIPLDPGRGFCWDISRNAPCDETPKPRGPAPVPNRLLRDSHGGQGI